MEIIQSENIEENGALGTYETVSKIYNMHVIEVKDREK